MQPLGLTTYQFALQPMQLAQQGIKACNGGLPGDWLMSNSTSGYSSSCCRWFRRFIITITRVRRSWGCAAWAEHCCRGLLSIVDNVFALLCRPLQRLKRHAQ